LSSPINATLDTTYFSSIIHIEGGDIMSERNWYTYYFKIGNRIVHRGITQDLDRREREHQQRWPDGHIVQVGGPKAEDGARAWEEEQGVS